MCRTRSTSRATPDPDAFSLTAQRGLLADLVPRFVSGTTEVSTSPEPYSTKKESPSLGQVLSVETSPVQGVGLGGGPGVEVDVRPRSHTPTAAPDPVQVHQGYGGKEE